MPKAYIIMCTLLVAILLCLVQATPLFPIYQDSHNMAALAMAMTSHAVKTHMDQKPNPIYTASMLASQLPSQHSLNISPKLISTLSDNLHIGNTVSLQSLHDVHLDSICEFINAGQGFYLIEMRSGNLVWPARCDITYDSITGFEDMTFHVHNPQIGKVMKMSLFEVASQTTLHEFFVSYNVHQEYFFNKLIATNNALLHTTATEKLQSMYTPIDEDDFVIPYPMPIFFKQCDPLWKNDIMTTQTVCAVGCLMSSVTVGLRNRGFILPNNSGGALPTPGTFNQYVRLNDGYDQDNLKHDVIDSICPDRRQTEKCYAKWDPQGRHATNDIPLDKIIEIMHDKHLHITANVNNGRHFVAIYSHNKSNPDILGARDSSGLAARDWFSYKDDIVGWRIYNMTGPKDFLVQKDSAEYYQDYPNLVQLAKSLGL